MMGLEEPPPNFKMILRMTSEEESGKKTLSEEREKELIKAGSLHMDN